MANATKRVRAPQMDPEARKKQLIEAGVSCIANKGIGGTKHADLARACAVSVPTVFTYFPNRESLVTSILDEVGERLLEYIIPRSGVSSSPVKQLYENARLFVEFTESQPDYVKVWLMCSMHFAPEIQQRYRKFETRLVDALVSMLREHAPGEWEEEDILDRAQIISASSSFLAKLVFDGVSDTRRDAFVDHIIDSMLPEE